MQRVMIIGGAGAGKSTLAVRLGELTGLPVVHIDPMYWKPGWIQREPAETHAMVQAAVQVHHLRSPSAVRAFLAALPRCRAGNNVARSL